MKKVRTPEEARKIAEAFARIGGGSCFTPPHVDPPSFFDNLFNLKRGKKNESRNKI